MLWASPRLGRVSRRLRALAALAVGALLTVPAQAPAAVTADPPFTTPFARSSPDLAAHCPGGAMRLRIDPRQDERVGVDGEVPRAGARALRVQVRPGERFRLEVVGPDRRTVHSVRCLPPDFPGYAYERTRAGRFAGYVLTPTSGLRPYVVIMSRHGVPIWWFRPPVIPSDGKVTPEGLIAFARADGSGFELRRPDGALVRRIMAVGFSTDSHDLQPSGGGRYMLFANARRDGVDLRAFGGSADAEVIETEIQEIEPSGEVSWRWNAAGRIALAETGRWWAEALRAPLNRADIHHPNSVEPSGDVIVISQRHTDSVYAIDRATGEIRWKLGGTPTPEQLRVVGDPYGDYPFGGQHDARIAPDGTLTVFDNATLLGRAARAVRYEIDEEAGVARMLEEIVDPAVGASNCCGSATRTEDGTWLIAWGAASFAITPAQNVLLALDPSPRWSEPRAAVTELGPDGLRNFRISWDEGHSYRVTGVPAATLSPAQLRAGMDAMHPRG